MALPPGIELVSDDRGVKCIRITLPGTPSNPVEYSLRADAAPEEIRYHHYRMGQRYGRGDTLLSTIPRKMRRTRGLFETSLARAIYSAMCKAWGKPRKTEQRKLFAFIDDSFRITNWMINELLATAHQPALKLARRFNKAQRVRVYWAAVDHPRLAQLLETWPALGLLCIDNEELRDMVNYGEPIDAIAKAADLGRCTRKIKPQVVVYSRGPLCQFYPEVVKQYLPKDWVRQLRFFRAMPAFLDEGDARATWFAKNLPFDKKLDELDNEATQIWDWMTGEHITNPKMSWETAKARSDRWHEAETMRACARNAELIARINRGIELESVNRNRPFPSPWVPGAAVDGYAIVPLINGLELDHEGASMHHCVGSYADKVLRGECYIYSVRKDGKSLATLELGKPWALNSYPGTEAGYLVSQLRGPCNQNPPDAVKKAVYRWLNEWHRERERKRACASQSIAPVGALGFELPSIRAEVSASALGGQAYIPELEDIVF